MKAVGISEIWLVLISLLGAPPVGITLPNQPEPDPAAEAARFQAVTGHLDPGGLVYAYLSVDQDLSVIAEFVKSYMDDLRPLARDVPEINIPEILRVTGLDAVSALGVSSVRSGDGFRNKTYIHTPNERRGLLLLLGEKPRPFESLKLAPSGADFVLEQDLNLKTFYDSMIEAAKVQMGEQGKTVVQSALKLPPSTPFSREKLMADLDTRLTVVIDADPTQMVKIPKGNGMKVNKFSGAVLIDGLGWIADELTKVFEPKQRQGSHFKIIRNANWVGLRVVFAERKQKAMAELGWDTAIFAHHVPSGKLVLATGKKFADQLFATKPGIGQDPEFLKAMKDLPTEGTALTYASPVFFSSLRNIFETLIADMDGDHNKDDRFMATTLLDLFLPKNARCEGGVTTSTKEGILTISNSAHSHKTSLTTGLASPLAIGVTSFMGAVKPREEVHAEELDTQEVIREAEELLREEKAKLESLND